MYLIILQLPFVNKLRYEDYFQNKLVRSHIAHWAKLTLTVIKAGWWKSKLIQKYLKNSVNYTCLSLLEIFFKKNSHLLSFGSRCWFMGCCFNNYKLKSISHFPSVFSAFVSPFSEIERLTLQINVCKVYKFVNFDMTIYGDSDVTDFKGVFAGMGTYVGL